MKITEVTKLQTLRESLQADTELTEQAVNNLMRIAEQAEHGHWSEPMTAEQAMAEVDRVLMEAGIKSE